MKITAIKQQAKRADRYSVFVDGRFVFGLSEAGLIDSRIASGQELTSAELRKLKKAAGLDKAYGNALRYVALRPRSEWELKDYFKRKGIDEVAGQQITERLRKVGLVDDLAFARAWTANRRLLKTISKRRLNLELHQKHLAPEVIAQVLDEDEADERSILGGLIAKKRARYPDRQKFMQYLARQGFSYGDIKSALSED